MAGPQIGYAGKVRAAADSAGTAGTYSDVGGTAKGSIKPKVAAPSTTDVNQPGFEKVMPGLTGADIEVDFFYEAGDAGQAILLNGITNKTRVWIRVYRDATHYTEAACYVIEFPNDVEPGVPERVPVKFAFDGTPATPLTIA
jgi:hypothetical protein